MQDLTLIQMEILKKLLFQKTARFSELKMPSVGTDLLAYHIKELLELGFIAKVAEGYALSSKGIDFAGRMDTETKKIERQPKVTMVLIVAKVINGKEQMLIQRRKKHPYFNYVGFPTGKIRFGETVCEAAEREFLEETGMIAEFTHSYVLHEMVYNPQGEILEDKFFNILGGTWKSGELASPEGGENFWATYEEFMTLSPKFHNEDEILEWFREGNREFKEKKYVVEQF